MIMMTRVEADASNALDLDESGDRVQQEACKRPRDDPASIQPPGEPDTPVGFEGLLFDGLELLEGTQIRIVARCQECQEAWDQHEQPEADDEVHR